MKLINNHDRSICRENRYEGLGFAFLKRDGDTFETTHPLSCCKDYLSDVVYVERSGKAYEQNNVSFKPQDLFKDGCGYLGISILPKISYDYSDKTKKEEVTFHETVNTPRYRQLFVDNRPKMVKALNWAEESMGLETRTTIEPFEDERFALVTMPERWTTATPLISMYTFILRISMFGFDATNPYVSLQKAAEDCHDKDYYMWNTVESKIQKVVEGYRFRQDWSKCIDDWAGVSPMSLGLVGYQF